MTESPLERICRAARERDDEMIANPHRHTAEDVAQAKLRRYQDERLSLASTLRYDD